MRLAVEQPGNETQAFFHDRTLLPGHRHLPSCPRRRRWKVLPMCPVRSVTYVSGGSQPRVLGPPATRSSFARAAAPIVLARHRACDRCAARQQGRIGATRLRQRGTLGIELYLPVKRFLVRLGFDVKGEVCGCDLVALREGEPVAVVIGELKLTFTLDLVLQAVDRTAACDEIWLAVRASRRGRGRESDARVKKLCRFLGFGLLAVTAAGKVDVLVEPVPWRPRRDARRRSTIVAEHRRRHGDPVAGGVTRQPIMTAYRQQALACAAALSVGAGRLGELKVGVP